MAWTDKARAAAAEARRRKMAANPGKMYGNPKTALKTGTWKQLSAARLNKSLSSAQRHEMAKTALDIRALTRGKKQPFGTVKVRQVRQVSVSVPLKGGGYFNSKIKRL